MILIESNGKNAYEFLSIDTGHEGFSWKCIYFISGTVSQGFFQIGILTNVIRWIHIIRVLHAKGKHKIRNIFYTSLLIFLTLIICFSMLWANLNLYQFRDEKNISFLDIVKRINHQYIITVVSIYMLSALLYIYCLIFISKQYSKIIDSKKAVTS
jgi:hypothetical protein